MQIVGVAFVLLSLLVESAREWLLSACRVGSFVVAKYSVSSHIGTGGVVFGTTRLHTKYPGRRKLEWYPFSLYTNP